MDPTLPHAMLPRATPESQGVDSAAVLQFIEALDSRVDEGHSFMLLRHGHVIAEGGWSPYGQHQPHLLFSLSKSFTATAVGLAIDEGYFALDDTVQSFFPGYSPTTENDLRATMRVRDLLSMSTGQAVDTWLEMVERPDNDWIAGFFAVPVVHTPGTQFVYNTGATYMLSAIVQKTTGHKVIDYLHPRLFAPLGIEQATWTESPQGITAGGIGLSITTEAIARFGQLYLQKGRWGGQQILPEVWVEAATTAQIGNAGVQPDWSQGYGYQFWRCRHNAYRGDGVFGQYCIVMPQQDAVLAMTSGIDVFDMQQPLNLVWDMLLPAMQPHTLPDNTARAVVLSSRLASLHRPPVQGRHTSPLMPRLAGQVYRMEANEYDIDSVTFTFAGEGGTLGVAARAGAETIPWGYGIWQPGQPTALFRQPLLFDRTPPMSSGAWTTDDVFTLVVRLVETPFYHTLTCHLTGDDLLIEVRINVSLESTRPVLLMGYADER